MGLFRIRRHDRNARRRPVANLHRNLRNRQLHESSGGCEQDPVGRLDADEATGERLERPIFSRDGRASKLTEDGQRLLDYARRIVKLNVETLAAFSDAELSGRVRMGVPDDYADRYLPEIMARFSHSYPAVELSVICEPSVDLLERIDGNEIDLAIITNCESKRASETFRRERLLWVTSNRHSTHLEERMPLALGRPSCTWRRIAIDRLETIGRPFRVLYSSSNAGAVAAAVLAGLAVSVLPESGLRPG